MTEAVAVIGPAWVAVTVYAVALNVVSAGMTIVAVNEPLTLVVAVIGVKAPPLNVMVVKVFAAKPLPARLIGSPGNALTIAPVDGVTLVVSFALTVIGWNRLGATPSETTILCTAPLTAAGMVTLIAKAPVAPVGTVPSSEAAEITSQYTLTVLPGLAVAFGVAPITCMRCPTVALVTVPTGLATAEVSHTPRSAFTTANAGTAAATIERIKSAVIAIVDSFLFICILFLFSYEFSVNRYLETAIYYLCRHSLAGTSGCTHFGHF